MRLPYTGSAVGNLYNNIIGNNSGQDCELHLSATIGTSNNNLIEDTGGSACSLTDGVNGNIVGSAPQLGPLQDNGGTTWTMAPSACSPAYDAADPATATTTDQIGQAIVGTRDIGAFENQTTGGTPMTVLNTSDDGGGSLREAICMVTTGGTVNFDAALSGQKITLASELVVNKNMTIQGTVPITVSGNNAVRVFNVTAGTVTFDSLTIADGNVPGGTDRGGGIFGATGTTLTIRDSTVRANSSGFQGGGLMNYGPSLVENSTFYGNSSTWGGGIHVSGTFTVNNSTFYNNTASSGGGALNANIVVVNINNSTIAGNQTGIRGHGTTFNLQNNIIADSTAAGDCTLSTGATVAINNNNLIEDTGGSACSLTNGGNGNIVGSAPLLGPLQDNGGTTWTMAPSGGSPAIDAGDFATCLSTDQRGIGRGATTCDIGAYDTQTSNRPSPVVRPARVYIPVVVKGNEE